MPLKLAFGLSFDALYSREGLTQMDALFLKELASSDAALATKLQAARAQLPSGKDESDLLMAVAPHAEDFIAKLFGIEKELHALAESHHALAPLYACKRLFVQRRALKAHRPEEAAKCSETALEKELLPLLGSKSFDELAFAKAVMGWLEDETKYASELTVAAKFAAWASYTGHYPTSVLFKHPAKIDPEHLVHKPVHLRHREGFALTDHGHALDKALDQAHYCIFCHHQGKDSCSKGLKEKDGNFKKNAAEITLAGCPLEEKISEMNELKAAGVPLGALAVAIVDNPMIAGTGHRICNDCMKSCIYQKQEPVDIPQVETRTLKDILHLPYGFEIYSLLTRWNPLNLARPLPKLSSGKRVLVVGLGPAGYTLSHHLMNDGHEVVAIDGLKIEPLAGELAGKAFLPIGDVKDIYEPLDSRVLAGFGGVAEYGITVRWDKNYLKLIRLLLERRKEFSMHGGVRFGGTITIDQAWELGFDHIALCMGAGKPTVLDIPNALARGVRAASDFLMALQLTGAAKLDSIANLQLRLPVVVIGGGLTAIDTATESLAYYPVQVEKFLERYETLVLNTGEGAVRAKWNMEEAQIADEFIAHAKAIRAERALAVHEGRDAKIVELLCKWGGVKMAYRKRLQDAPSYRLNHEEVQKALEEGIEILENHAPEEIELDAFGHAKAVRFNYNGASITLPARAILVAAGTSPNTVLQREDPAHVELDGRFFRAVDETGAYVKPERVTKPKTPHVLMSVDKKGRAISFFGDLHPSFAGNVVKAMASAKQGYPVISRMLAKRGERQVVSGEREKINPLFQATVVRTERLTPTIVEVIVHAPLAARNFQPGQFYRLQNFDAYAHPALSMEGLAMTGAWVDKEKGLVSVIVLEMGGSSDLCIHLKPGEPVILMGPTGAPTHVSAGETVLLLGGGLGNAVLFSIGKAFRDAGSKVLYFAGYRQAQDRYKIAEIEAASDVVVWCCDEAADFKPSRPQDRAFTGNIIAALEAYATGKIGENKISLRGGNRLIAIGSDRMMAAVAQARHTLLKNHLNPEHEAIGSINSPMQCMMKEICAQCLQQHVNQETGEITYVYSCFNQDQRLDEVSFPHLAERLRQNGTQEKLTAQWINHCLHSSGLR